MTNVKEPEAIEQQFRELFRAGEREAAAILLLETHGTEIFRFVLSRLRDPDAASEVFSQFTEDLWRGLPGFRMECSARTWSYMLARHAASKYVAAVRRKREREEPLSSGTGLHDVAERIRTQTLNVARTEVKSRVAELRERLPLDDQTLLILRVNRGLDWKEIARVMLDPGEIIEERDLNRQAARLRQRFQAVKGKLRSLAEEAGLLNDGSDPREE